MVARDRRECPSEVSVSETPAEAFVCTTPRYELHYFKRRSLALTAAPTGYTLRCVLHGHVRLSVSGDVVELHPGMTALLNPVVRHALRSKRGSVEMVTVHLHPGLIADMAARLRLTRIGQEFTFRECAVADPHLAALCTSAREELRRRGIGHEVVLDALVDHILVHLFRHHLLVRRNLDLEFSRFGFVDRRLRRAIEFIHAHSDEDVRLKDMARAAFLSAFHFARLFKRLVGMTPHAYLMGVRLEKAARLLVTTDLSMLEISRRVGYASQSHFAKAFKAWTGLTPREYRQASLTLLLSPPLHEKK
jgi:AraC family transcriptional regulator